MGNKINKRILLVAILSAIVMFSASASINPTGGWRLSIDGALLSTNGTGGLGYGYELGGYLGADINRWSQFFGEVSASVSKTELSASRFTSLKPPFDMYLGGGWCFSPGAGWSISLSGGYSIMKVSHSPDIYATGIYAAIIPRWVVGTLDEVAFKYYNYSISFPIQLSYASGIMHLKIGVSLGADVSIYTDRRGNSFTGVSY